MTVDLERQIRDYASHVTELSTPVDVERVRLESPAEARRVPRYRRFEARWAAGMAAAAVILALIGGLALGYQLLAADEPPVITEPAPTPSTSLPAPTTSLPSPTTLVDSGVAPSMTWERVPPQASLGAGDDDHEYLMNAVINGGPGLIAGGGVRANGDIYYSGIPAPGDQAAVWTSEDGVAWERIPTEESGLAGPGGYSILDLVAGGPGYVAVGEAMEDGSSRPAVWVSEGGLAWTRVESDTFGEGDMLSALAAGKEGVVAVGGGDIWFSPDGWAWQRAVSPPKAYFSDVDHADRGFVAVGYVEEPLEVVDGAPAAEAFRAFVAISPDGVNWEGVDLPEDESWYGAQASSIVARGDELVVAGSYRTRWGTYFDMHPAFWTSTDDSSWERYGVPRVSIRGMDRPSAFISDLAATRSGIVAVGGWFHYSKAPGDSPKTRAAVWASAQPGGPWGEIPSMESFAIEAIEPHLGTTVGISSVAVLGDVLVGVSTDAGEAVVWIGEWTD